MRATYTRFRPPTPSTGTTPIHTLIDVKCLGFIDLAYGGYVDHTTAGHASIVIVAGPRALIFARVSQRPGLYSLWWTTVGYAGWHELPAELLSAWPAAINPSKTYISACMYALVNATRYRIAYAHLLRKDAPCDPNQGVP